MKIYDIVAYCKKKVEIGYINSISNKRINLTLLSNKVTVVNPSSIIKTWGTDFKETDSREEVHSYLKDCIAGIEICKDIDMELLYNCCETSAKYDFEEIARLWFGKNKSITDELKLLISISRDKTYFKISGNQIKVLPPEEVSRNRAKKRVIDKAKKERELIYTDFCNILEDIKVPGERVNNYILILSTFILKSTGYSNYGYYNSILSELKNLGDMDNFHRANEILKKLGAPFNREKVLLENYSIYKKLDDMAKERLTGEIKDITGVKIGSPEKRHRFIFTVDNRNTQDFDDAVSYAVEDKKYKIGIHITDVGYFVKKDSEIDRFAYDNIASLYLPDVTIPMLPFKLSTKLLSLKKKKDRKVISYYFTFSDKFKLVERCLKEEVIRVDNNMTYEEVDAAIKNTEDKHHKMFTSLYMIAERLKKDRIKNGAIEFRQSELTISVDKGGKVDLEMKRFDSGANNIIKEFMLLYNSAIGQFFFENNIPAIYRNQLKPEPRKKRLSKIEKTDIKSYIVPPVKLSNIPGSHGCLGLSKYTQLTSPVRRYTDLIMQRQLSNFVNKSEILYYDNVQLLTIAKDAENKYIMLKRVGSKIIDYWKYVYISQNMDKTFKADIVKYDGNLKKTVIFVEAIQKEFNADFIPEKNENEIEVKFKNVDLLTLKVEIEKN